jgi:hypothetical protein
MPTHFSFSLKREKSAEESSPKSKRGEIGDGKSKFLGVVFRSVNDIVGEFKNEHPSELKRICVQTGKSNPPTISCRGSQRQKQAIAAVAQ